MTPGPGDVIHFFGLCQEIGSFSRSCDNAVFAQNLPDQAPQNSYMYVTSNGGCWLTAVPELITCRHCARGCGIKIRSAG